MSSEDLLREILEASKRFGRIRMFIDEDNKKMAIAVDLREGRRFNYPEHIRAMRAKLDKFLEKDGPDFISSVTEAIINQVEEAVTFL